MSKFKEYSNQFNTIRMERKNGILLVTFHQNGGPMEWNQETYVEYPRAFAEIGNDPENKCVIFTGTGNAFSGPHASANNLRPKKTPQGWYPEYWGGKRLIMNLLDIEVPTIAAVNGPALRHCEIPLLCDIVIGSKTAAFQDTAHFVNSMVPGDGMHIIFPLLLGLNRGKYFLMTGQRIEAQEALELGLIVEVHAKNKLLPRAWQLAEQFVKHPPLVTRFTKAILNHRVKELFHDTLGYGLAVEGMAVAQGWDSPHDIKL